jgi:hypothetical protein
MRELSIKHPVFLRNSRGLFGPKRGEVVCYSDGEVPDVYMLLRVGGSSYRLACNM